MVSWYKSLIEDNVNYRLFSRKNKSVFYVMIHVLEMHQNLNIDNFYILWLKPPKGMDSDLEDEDKVWIPSLPGYSILIKKGKVYKIDYQGNNELEYIYENFDNDCTLPT
jgi:hypothetical protein